MFDVNPRLVGLVVRGVEIRGIEDLEQFIKDNDVQIAALTIPKSKAPEIADRLDEAGIKAILEFCPHGSGGSRRRGGGERPSVREPDAAVLSGMQHAGSEGEGKKSGKGKRSKMIAGVGTDMIEIARIKRACEKKAFLTRVYHPGRVPAGRGKIIPGWPALLPLRRRCPRPWGRDFEASAPERSRC